MNTKASLPIGMFDSGVGRPDCAQGTQGAVALRGRHLSGRYSPAGPTGPRSPQTVTRYGVQCGAELVRRDIKLLVVACNTASAVALDALRAANPDLPVIGVVEPGAPRGLRRHLQQCHRGHCHGIHHHGRCLPTGHPRHQSPGAHRGPSLPPFRGPGRRRLDRRHRARSRRDPLSGPGFPPRVGHRQPHYPRHPGPGLHPLPAPGPGHQERGARNHHHRGFRRYHGRSRVSGARPERPGPAPTPSAAAPAISPQTTRPGSPAPAPGFWAPAISESDVELVDL